MKVPPHLNFCHFDIQNWGRTSGNRKHNAEEYCSLQSWTDSFLCDSLDLNVWLFEHWQLRKTHKHNKSFHLLYEKKSDLHHCLGHHASWDCCCLDQMNWSSLQQWNLQTPDVKQNINTTIYTCIIVIMLIRAMAQNKQEAMTNSVITFFS